MAYSKKYKSKHRKHSNTKHKMRYSCAPGSLNSKTESLLKDTHKFSQETLLGEHYCKQLLTKLQNDLNTIAPVPGAAPLDDVFATLYQLPNRMDEDTIYLFNAYEELQLPVAVVPVA
jgi:hypothetical protein